MDRGKRNPYFPASILQENNSDNTPRRNGFTEFHPRNNRPLYTDQPSLESMFSGLSLQGDRINTPSFGVPPVDNEILMGLRAQYSAEWQGLIRAHQNLNVGPNPDIRGDILPRMMMNLPVALQAQQQQQQLYSEDDYLLRCNYDVADCGYPFLHTTLPLLPAEPTSQFQFPPCLNDHRIVPSLSDYSSYMNNFVPRNLNFGAPNLKDNQSGLMGCNELRGKMVTYANDQQGSKMLQAKLEKGNKEEIENVLSEVIDYVGDLMKNQSGSYVIQKLFVVCNEEQRTTIIQAITRSTHQFIGICFSQHGARAMQKLLDNLSTPQQRSLILSAITPVAVALANDQSGQHVIQYCVKTFSIEYTRHLLNEIANNCFAIATQKSGCCVLQSCVESARGELRDHLITEILTNAVQLSEDQYGNYVVQHLVGLKLPLVTETLLDMLQGNFVTLSCNKYASNVVEKIILESGEEHSTRIITELLRSTCASMLLVDPYGNFVIQTALQIATA
ncbi:hypothetical protein K7X08_001982 [Anisodus acutangulus]|uniref:PUM-HD domain-containing protein n=1 Tax=Anisodus acutangulus TaxID=402998 RepID=A0A9Q1LNC2_9SOLA|nr:hypothetical protein K7X08_001982 [Anisodus acutangulus]